MWSHSESASVCWIFHVWWLDGGKWKKTRWASRVEKEILSKCVHLNMIVEFRITLLTSPTSPLERYKYLRFLICIHNGFIRFDGFLFRKTLKSEIMRLHQKKGAHKWLHTSLALETKKATIYLHSHEWLTFIRNDDVRWMPQFATLKYISTVYFSSFS